MERVYYTSAPKYTRSGSVAATAAYTPTSAAATLDHRVPRFPRNTDKSRGLRHFSNRVCEKVKEKGQTNYNEVADELVAEYFDSLSYPPQSQEKQQYDSKNIRRRVYDALNVLMAMNIIEKEKKEIRWVGLPTSSVAERRRLEEERTQRQERIRQKSDQLREYIIQLVAYKSLVHRNRETERSTGRPPEQSILYLPFIILNTERETNVDCAISHDKTEYAMTFDRAFEIHDDIEVLKRLGMSHGLDHGQVAEEDVERVKECLPPALRVYVDQLIEGRIKDEAQIDVPIDEATVDVESTYDAADSKYSVINDAYDDGAAAVAPTPSVIRSVQPLLQTTRSHSAVTTSTASAPPPSTTTVVTRRAYATPAPRSVGSFAQPVGYARPIVVRGNGRTFVQRASTAGRYIQPSQSAVYQNVQRNTRQQLYLVQSNGGAPQPIAPRYEPYPTPRYQAYATPRAQHCDLEEAEVDPTDESGHYHVSVGEYCEIEHE